MVLIAIFGLAGCKKSSKTEVGVGLPKNEDVMATVNGWEVVGQGEIPNEFMVDDVELRYMRQHGNQVDALVVTKTALQGVDVILGHRWRFNLKGSTLKIDKEVPYRAKSNLVGGGEVDIYPKFLYSSGMGDNDFYMMNSQDYWNTTNTQRIFIGTTGAWGGNIHIGPYGTLGPQSFTFAPGATNGYPAIARVIGKEHFINYPTEVLNAGGGIAADGELVTMAYSFYGQTEGISVWKSTPSLASVLKGGVYQICYTAMIRNIYKFSDISSDSFVQGFENSWSYQRGDKAWVHVTASEKASLFELDLNTQTLKLAQANAGYPKGIAYMIPEKPGHFVDVRNRNNAWYYDGSNFSPIPRPSLNPGVGAFMWDMVYSDGYVWLLCEYKKTMVALRRKL